MQLLAWLEAGWAWLAPLLAQAGKMIGWALAFAGIQWAGSEVMQSIISDGQASFQTTVSQGASWRLPDFSAVSDWLSMADTFFPVHEVFGMLNGLAATWAGCWAWRKIYAATHHGIPPLPKR